MWVHLLQMVIIDATSRKKVPKLLTSVSFQNMDGLTPTLNFFYRNPEKDLKMRLDVDVSPPAFFYTIAPINTS